MAIGFDSNHIRLIELHFSDDRLVYLFVCLLVLDQSQIFVAGEMGGAH